MPAWQQVGQGQIRSELSPAIPKQPYSVTEAMATPPTIEKMIAAILVASPCMLWMSREKSTCPGEEARRGSGGRGDEEARGGALADRRR